MAGDQVTEALPPDLPELPEGWEWKPLRDYVPAGRGISYGIVQPGDYDPNGIPILRAENVQNSRVELRDVLRVSPAIESKYKRTRLTGGEILITLVGAYFGKVAVAPKAAAGYNTARAVGVVPVQSDEMFLSHALQSPICQRYMQTWATTTAQPTLNLGDAGRIPIPSPPPKVRQTIAAVLGSLDDKIELNRRMNATLEAMARALFQSWFVDFDPVRAKLDGRQSPGLDRATADLFPASFQDSELGGIPRRWQVGRVAEISDFSRSSINPGEFPDEVFDHYSLPAFDEGRTPKAELGSTIMSNKLVVTPNSVLLSKLNPHIPRIWLPDLHPTRRSVCSTEFIVASTRPGYSREFLFSLFASTEFSTTYGTLVTGTTGSHQRIRPESVLEMKIVIPRLALIQAFTTVAKPMFDQINRNIDQSRTLATLRDTLLPKMLSGELSANEPHP